MAVRFGVAGTSTWAREVHIPGLQARGDIQLVGIWGRRIETAREIAGPLGITAFENFKELLDAVDAVSIAVQPDVQPQLAVLAANAAKHLLLEKPLSTALLAAQEIVDCVMRNRLSSIVFFTRRFVPEIEDVIQHASTQPWRHAVIRIHSTALTTGPFSKSVWRRADGAELWDIGPHVISILDPILGPVASLEASRESGGITRLETVHSKGGTASVSLTLRATPADAVTEFRFLSDKAELILPERAFSRLDAYARAAGELVGNILRRERAHRCDVQFGLDVVRVLAAADLSISQGRPVPVLRT